MKLGELTELLAGDFHFGADKTYFEITYICAGDLLSDILVFSKPNALLLTGLVNLQVVRTAEMLDVGAVMLVRGKKPTEEMLALAKTKNIPLLSTPKTMYLSCGILFQAGLMDVSEECSSEPCSTTTSIAHRKDE